MAVFKLRVGAAGGNVSAPKKEAAAEPKESSGQAPPTAPPPVSAPRSEPIGQIPTSSVKPQQAAAAKVVATPSPSAPGQRTEQRVKINRMRARIATRLKEAQNTYAMLTTFNEIDMT